MRDLVKRRKAFKKELLAALGPVVKGTGWKKNRSALVRQSGAFFQDIVISVYLNDEKKIGVVQTFKPMALDTLLWDILGMSENASEPLSFRTWGAFTCSGLPIYEALLEPVDSSAVNVAEFLGKIARTNKDLFDEVLKTAKYSTLLANHTHQLEHGAYAVALVTSLINDGDYEGAADLAGKYESGELKSCSQLSSYGVSFHRLALDWLDAGKAITAFAINPIDRGRTKEA